MRGFFFIPENVTWIPKNHGPLEHVGLRLQIWLFFWLYKISVMHIPETSSLFFPPKCN